MKYPENIKTKKQKVCYWLFRHIYIFEQGKGQVMGRLFSTYTEIGVTVLMLDKFGVKYSLLEAGVFVAVVFSLFYFFGYFYLKYSIDKINAQIGQDRNPQLMEIHKRIVGNKRDDFGKGI